MIGMLGQGEQNANANLGAFRAFSFLFVPGVAAAAALAGNQVFLLAGLSIGLGLLGLISAPANDKSDTINKVVLSLSLVGQAALLNSALAGHPWQIDSHMVYFALLAMIATLRSIPALLAATAVVALHHLTLGLFLPVLVYPSTDLVINLERTLFHAAIVLVETGVLLRMIIRQDRSDAAHVKSEADQKEIAEDAAMMRVQSDEDRKAATAAVTSLGDRLRIMAGGNLNVLIDEELPPAYEGLRADFNATIAVLSDLISQNADLAESFSAEASAVAQAASSMAHGLESHAYEVNQTADALRHLTSSVSQTAEDVAEVDSTFAQTAEKAGHGSDVVNRAVETINSIKASSDAISKIIQVIEDISFQTNLLALNAGVEAARAGEHGRGFAVVASEVRALSVRTSDAAREVKDLITSSAELVAGGVESVGAAGEVLSEIVADVRRASGLIHGLADQTGLQSQGLDEMARSIDTIDNGLQRYAAETEELSATGERVADSAGDLRGALSQFEIAQTAGVQAQAS